MGEGKGKGTGRGKEKGHLFPTARPCHQVSISRPSGAGNKKPPCPINGREQEIPKKEH